jgi:hypothetical protein
LLGRGDRSSGQLDAILLTVQLLLGFGLDGDNVGGPRYLALELGIAQDGHELHVTWPPQDDVVRSGEVNHFETEHLGAIIARDSEGDRKSNLPKGDELLARDHSVERVWAALELVPGEP